MKRKNRQRTEFSADCLFFEFFYKGIAAFLAADLKSADFPWHTDRGFAMRAGKKTGRFPFLKTNEEMADLMFHFCGEAIPVSIFLLPFDDVFGQHPKKDRKAQDQFHQGKKHTAKDQIQNRQNEPKKGQKLIEGIGSVASQHKTGKRCANSCKKVHLLLLPPITMARSLKNWVKETARAAT